MAQWTVADPGAGSMANVSGSASTLSTASSRIEGAHESAQGAQAKVTGAWTGGAVADWQAKVTKLVNGLSDYQNALTGARRAVDGYKSSVESIQSRADSYHREIQDAKRLVHDIPFMRAPWDVEGMADDVIRKTKSAAKDIDAVQGLVRLSVERQQADDALVRALNRAVPASWSDERKMFDSVGITKASEVNPTSLGAALAKLSDGIDSSVFGKESRQKLNELLDLYGDDESVMKEFLAKLGGAGVADLMNKLGSSVLPGQDNSVTLAIAQKVRSALSIVSKGKDPRFGAAFAKEMFYGPEPYPSEKADFNASVQSRVEAIGWLFSDPDHAPMGEAMTVEMAKEVDKWEFVDKKGTLATYGPLETGTAGRLYAVEHTSDKWGLDGGFEGSATDGIASDDAAGRVLETLGHYPDQALAFLSTGNPTTDSARLTYWFQTRDWSGADKFQGPAGLWLGIQQAPGGAYSANYDNQSALMTSKILWALFDNPTFSTDNTSERASAELATALAPNLDTVSRYFLDGGSDATKADTKPGNSFGTGIERPVPRLSNEVFARLMGVIGSHEAGSTVLQRTIDMYQNYYRRASEVDPAVFGDGMVRGNWLQGVLDGSGAQAKLTVAIKHDKEVDDEIDFLMDIVGLIPIPGASEVIKGSTTLLDGSGEVLNHVLDFAGDQVLDQSKKAGVDLWKGGLHTTESVTAANESQDIPQRVRALMAVVDQVRGVLGDSAVGPIPPARPSEDADAYGNRLLDWWVDRSTYLQKTSPIDNVVLNNLSKEYTDAREAAGGYAG